MARISLQTEAERACCLRDDDASGDDENDHGGNCLRYDNLPNRTKPAIKTQVVPSILEYLGAQDDP